MESGSHFVLSIHKLDDGAIWHESRLNDDGLSGQSAFCMSAKHKSKQLKADGLNEGDTVGLIDLEADGLDEGDTVGSNERDTVGLIDFEADGLNNSFVVSLLFVSDEDFEETGRTIPVIAQLMITIPAKTQHSFLMFPSLVRKIVVGKQLIFSSSSGIA